MKTLALALTLVSMTAFAAETTTTRSMKKTTNKDGSTTVEETTVTKTKSAPGEKVETVAAEEEASKEDFKTKMKAQLDSLSAQIDSLKKDASTASSDAKASIEKKAAELDVKRAEVARELDRASDKTGRAWTKFKAGLQKAVGEIQDGYKEAKTEMNKDAAKNDQKTEKK